MKLKYLFNLFLLTVLTQFLYAQNEIWEKVNDPSREEIVSMTISNDGKIFIADNLSGIYKTENFGTTWDRIFSSGGYSVLYREMIVGADSNLYVAARNYVLVMNQQGYEVYSKYFQTDVYSLSLNSQLNLYVATKDSGISRTTNYGESWDVNILLPDSNYHFTSVAIDDSDNIFVGSNQGIFKSTDNGYTWYSKNTGLNDLYVFNIMCTSNNYLFETGNYGISRSTNGGESWEYVNNGIQGSWVVNITEDDNSNLFFGDQDSFGNGKIYKSTNWGESWNNIFQTNAGGIAALQPDDDYIFTGTFESGLYRAYIPDSSLKTICLNPTSIQHFAESISGDYYCSDEKLSISKDFGNSWKLFGLPVTGFWNQKDSLLFVGASGKVGLVNDSRINYYWRLGNDDQGAPSMVIYEPDSNFIFTSALGNIYADGGVYRGKLDTNEIILSKLNNGLNSNSVSTLAINSVKDLFAGVSFVGVYRSTNLGLNWELVDNGLTDLSVRTIKIDKEDRIFTCTYSGIYLSTNDGNYWSKIANYEVDGFVVDKDNNLYIGAYNKVLKSTDFGVHWIEYGGEFPNCRLNGLFLSDSSYLFAYTTKGTYRSNDPVTYANNDFHSKKINYSLSQNFPNPFNPSTKIEFRISHFGFVSLKVFDVLGREVQTLVNETKKPGTYEVQFDGNNLSSGIYFYRIKADNFIETKKMILLK